MSIMDEGSTKWADAKTSSSRHGINRWYLVVPLHRNVNFQEYVLSNLLSTIATYSQINGNTQNLVNYTYSGCAVCTWKYYLFYVLAADNK